MRTANEGPKYYCVWCVEEGKGWVVNTQMVEYYKGIKWPACDEHAEKVRQGKDFCK